MIVLIPLSLWGLLQLVSAITSRNEISAFLVEGHFWLHESISSLWIVVIGVSLTSLAALILGYEARAVQIRRWLARPAAATVVVGIALAVSGALYKTVPANVVNSLTASVSPARALAGPKTPRPAHQAPSGEAGATTEDESQPPAGADAESSTSTAPKQFCSCPPVEGGTARPEGGEGSWEPEEEWAGPEEREEPEEEEWEEPEEEWEEGW